jgi:hypothetical protein
MKMPENSKVDFCQTRLYMRIALFALMSVSAADYAAARSFDIQTPLTVASPQPVALNSHVQVTSPLWVGNGASIYLYVTGGLTGMGKAPAGARLDVQSSGSGKVQIWRNSGNTEVASISDTTGYLTSNDCTSFPRLPSGTVMLFDTSCPSGWTELTAARGRYLVGLPASGSLAGTQGTVLGNLENRAVGQHNHTTSETQHLHTGSCTAAASDCHGVIAKMSEANWALPTNVTGSASANWSVTDVSGGAPAGTNAPYIQLLVCQKEGS